MIVDIVKKRMQSDSADNVVPRLSSVTHPSFFV